MKKLRSFFVGIVSIIIILALLIWRMKSTDGSNSEKQLIIYNWGDYIDPTLLTKFEKESGLKVIYETFDSNEAMFTKVKQGGTNYDVTIPSEYMIVKMKQAHLLEKIDSRKLQGLENISQRFLNLSFDSHNQYSIPYFWGTLGIVYNDKLIAKQPPKHWNDLWDKKNRDNVMLIDGAREVMGFGLNSLNFSLNSKDYHKLQKASQKLDKLTPNVKAIVADEMKMYMAQGEAAICVTFSGEACEMLNQNKHLHYVIPSEGSNLWFDNLVIPKTVKNKKGAYQFINFMLRPENARQNAEYIGYATPNVAALKLLPKKIKENKSFYPTDEVLNHLEVYQNLGPKWLEIYNDLFLNFKMYRK